MYNQPSATIHIKTQSFLSLINNDFLLSCLARKKFVPVVQQIVLMLNLLDRKAPMLSRFLSLNHTLP